LILFSSDDSQLEGGRDLLVRSSLAGSSAAAHQRFDRGSFIETMGGYEVGERAPCGRVAPAATPRWA
jgi:hypothetical protein